MIYDKDNPPEIGAKVHVLGHSVVGRVEKSSNEGVTIIKEDGGSTYWGSFYFEQMSKIEENK